jgi:uncharacterized protein YraI
MKRLLGPAAAAMLAVLPHAAEAYWASVVTDLNLRACASATCARLAVMPRGATVWVNGSVGGWDSVTWGGLTGFASARYLFAAAVPGPLVRPPPPTFGFYVNPWWDPRYGAWYDGRRWYFNGRWYDQPSGFWFGFSIGR